MEVKATSSSGPIFSSNWRHCGLISNTRVTHWSSMVRILDESKSQRTQKFLLTFILLINCHQILGLIALFCVQFATFLLLRMVLNIINYQSLQKLMLSILLLKICIWLRLYYRDTLAYSSLHKPTISSNKISISQPLCQTFNV